MQFGILVLLMINGSDWEMAPMKQSGIQASADRMFKLQESGTTMKREIKAQSSQRPLFQQLLVRY